MTMSVIQRCCKVSWIRIIFCYNEDNVFFRGGCLSIWSTDWSPFPVHVIVIQRTTHLPPTPGKDLSSHFSPGRWCAWSPAWLKCPLPPPPCISLTGPSGKAVSASSLTRGPGSTGTRTSQQPVWLPEEDQPSTPAINSKTETSLSQFGKEFSFFTSVPRLCCHDCQTVLLCWASC